MFNTLLTNHDMERRFCEDERAADMYLDAWYRERRAEAVPPIYTHPMTCRHTGQARGVCTCPGCLEAFRRIESVLQATDAHLLDTMQRTRPGALPGLPQSLDGALTMAEVGRVACRVKGVG
jgi:hypothetical protein